LSISRMLLDTICREEHFLTTRHDTSIEVGSF
jgi:hypothetical protein